MSLLPARFQTTDDMPMSLGKAIARAIAPKLCEKREFETGDYRYLSGLPAHPKLQAAYIDEANSRQIKGAAQASTTAEKVGTTRPLPVVAPPSQKFKVGDRVRDINALHGDLIVVSVGEKVTSAQRGNDSVLGFLHHELIPSPDAEADGWVSYKLGDEAPSDCMEFLIRWSDGDERRYKNLRLSLNDDLRTWDGNQKSKVVAYKVLA